MTAVAHRHKTRCPSRPPLQRAAVSISNGRFVEGRDYTLNAAGRFVLTRRFLLSRGTCCGSGCANCPYGYESVPATLTARRGLACSLPQVVRTQKHPLAAG